MKISFKTIPATTAIKAPGTNFNFFKRYFIHEIRMIKETNVITIAPN
jgi:hypothetical protein